MLKCFDKPITIQKIDEVTELWQDAYVVHASINKTKTDSQYLADGATRTQKNLTFEVRYFKALEAVGLNFQGYRIMYNNTPFSIEDYDDYMQQHKTVKLVGVSY